MKKQLLLATALLICPVLVQAADRDKVEKAIEESDPVVLKKFLKRMGPLEAKEKKALLEIAEDALDEREAHVSVFKSQPDLVKFVGGAAFGSVLTAIAYFYGFTKDFPPSKLVDGRWVSAREKKLVPKWPSLLVWSGLSLPGFITAFKGFTCSSAKSRVAQARKVVAEVKKAEVIGGEQLAVQEADERD